MSCETRKHAEDPSWAKWELHGRTRARESRLCPDCRCVVSREASTDGVEALAAGLACWFGVYAIISDINTLIENFNRAIAHHEHAPAAEQHRPPSPTELNTIGELRERLRASGWVLAAGRRDGLTWAMIEKPGGDRIRVEDDASLSEVIGACLQLAAQHSLEAHRALGTN